MAKATYVLEIDWNNDGVFTGTGENVTSRMLRVTYQRGRDYASQLRGRAKGGKLLAVLDNSSGDYNFFNTGGPIYGNIIQGVAVQLRSTAPDVATLWRGFLQDVVPMAKMDNAHMVQVKAAGPLTFYNDENLNVAMQTSRGSGAAVGDVLDAAGIPAGDRTLDTGQETFNRWWVDRKKLIPSLREIENSEMGYIGESADGKILFEDRHHRLKSPHYTSQATWTDALGGALTYGQPINQRTPLKEIFNVVRTEVQLYSVGSLAVLWTLAAAGATSPAIANGAAFTAWASYPNPDSGNDAVAVDAWTTPVATTDWTVNAAADGSGSNLTGSCSVAVSKFANSMKIAITNSSGTDGFLTFLQARGTGVTARRW